MNASKFFSELSIALSREHIDVSSDTGEFLSVEFNGQAALPCNGKQRHTLQAGRHWLCHKG